MVIHWEEVIGECVSCEEVKRDPFVESSTPFHYYCPHSMLDPERDLRQSTVRISPEPSVCVPGQPPSHPVS